MSWGDEIEGGGVVDCVKIALYSTLLVAEGGGCYFVLFWGRQPHHLSHFFAFYRTSTPFQPHPGT